MTYRDDRDATLARADALEQDLKRAEAERDRLKAQIEKLEHERSKPPPPGPPVPLAPPVQAIVKIHNQALTPLEVTSLLNDVDAGLVRTRGAIALVRVVFALMIVASLPFYFTFAWGWGVALSLLGIAGSVTNGLRAAINDTESVMSTLRERPDEVEELVESKGALTIVTRTKSARCSTLNRAELLVRLARYCPGAIVRGGPV